MNLSDFDYHLPKELIAQYPLKERDCCRLLVLERKDSTIRHCLFRDILAYLNAGDLLVLNDTKVLASRLIGRRLSGGKVEVLLTKKRRGLSFEAMLKPARLKVGERVVFNSSAEIPGFKPGDECNAVSGGNPRDDNNTARDIVTKRKGAPDFSPGGSTGSLSGIISARDEISFLAKGIGEVYRLGVMPLPPYIKRAPQKTDASDYQTIYARYKGAIASPTAGLHFTKDLLEDIANGGVDIGYLTLHVGLGTFKPVKRDDITQHKMEPEYLRIPKETVRLLRKAHLENKRIFSVGTTSLRALESQADLITDCQSPIANYENSTNLFIYPGYKFKVANCLLTNFHLPRTTLFMLACAFAGEKLLKKAYQEAIDRRYRFYSYGDAMLII